MKEKSILRFAVLVFWTCFWGLSVVDKIIPDVHFLWVGKEFYALFIKFFSSLGLKDPIFATIALAGISALEVLNFVFYSMSTFTFLKDDEASADRWFFRAIVSSISLFALFSIGDQIFGDRFQLLEHGLFWLVLLASWFVFSYFSGKDGKDLNLSWSSDVKLVVVVGLLMTVGVSLSILDFSDRTFSNVDAPVEGVEVVDGVWKFDFPFLADKLVWEKTINEFKENHPELEIVHIYTGPGELNSKKKTHMLLYLFTEG